MKLLLIQEDNGIFSVTTITALGKSLLCEVEHLASEGFWEEWSEDISYVDVEYMLEDYFGIESE